MEEDRLENEELISLPEGWVWIALEELAITPQQDIVDGPFGSDLKASEYVDRGIPIIRLQNIDRNFFIDKNIKFVTEEKSKELDRHSFISGDIVITKLGDPLGEACVVPPKFDYGIIVADIVRARLPWNLVNKKYIVYGINSPIVAKQFSKATKGSTRPRVNLSFVRGVNIPFAPLPEQHRIVAKIEEHFTQLDAAETALKRAKANLERYRRSVLQAAVSGELSREWRLAHPDIESVASSVKRIIDERGFIKKGNTLHELNGSDLFSLPDKWEWVRIGSILDIKLGGTPSRNKLEYWNGGIPWVSSSEVSFSRIKNTRETISEIGLKNSNVKLFPKGTVLLGMIGEGKTRGQSAILEIEAGTNQNIAAILCGDSIVLPEWLYYWFMYDYENTRKSGAGGMQYALNSERVGNLIFPLPPIQEQDAITSEINLRFDDTLRIEKNLTINLQRIYKLRQSILDKAFLGQIVSQNPEDEPASILLERIKAERAANEVRQKTERPKKEKIKMTGEEKRLPLYETLHAVGIRLTPVELFKRAGFNEESVDEFYEELRQELQIEIDGVVSKKGRIKEERPNNTEVYLAEVKA